MNLSFDEYGALVAKAFRGAGYPWGLTEDASWAARRLAEVDETSPEVVLDLLAAQSLGKGVAGMPNADWSTNDAALCPICVGTAILDSRTADVTLGPVYAPELLTPFLIQLLGSDPQKSDAKFGEIRWETGGCIVSAQKISRVGSRTTIAGQVQISMRVDLPAGRRWGSDTSFGRVILETNQLEQLERLAHRIYAPATNESRSGAGAGSTDND